MARVIGQLPFAVVIFIYAADVGPPTRKLVTLSASEFFRRISEQRWLVN